MAGAASAHQAATAIHGDTSQEKAGRRRRTSADLQRAQQGGTAAAVAAPVALDSLSRIQRLADTSPQVAQLRRLQALADNHYAPLSQLAGDPEEKELVRGQFATAVLPPQRQQAPRPNNTGLPDQLKSGIESLSGLSMDHVRVHYNSAQPAQLNALAYAQGSDIHLAPGQERHLPHEAWHVVQQAQGRVQTTLQMKEGVLVNDDVELEREADVMGARAESGIEIVESPGASKRRDAPVNALSHLYFTRGQYERRVFTFGAYLARASPSMDHLQRRASKGSEGRQQYADAHQAATHGIVGSSGPMPHLNTIQLKNSAKERSEQMEATRKAIETALENKDGHEATNKIDNLIEYMNTEKRAINVDDLRVFSNFVNFARPKADRLINRKEPSAIVLDGANVSPIKIVKEYQKVKAILPKVLTLPVHEIAALNKTASFIVYHSNIGSGEGTYTDLACVSRRIPKHGFATNEWNQNKALYTTVEAATAKDLETEVGNKLKGMATNKYDFLAVKTKQKYQFRFLPHGNPAYIGHGSMIEIQEQSHVAGNLDGLDEDIGCDTSNNDSQIEVLFAGQFILGAKGLEKWDNSSGHFKPATGAAYASPLPIDKYHSGHIHLFKESSSDLAALIIKELVTIVDLKQSDIQALVGGDAKIKDHQIVDDRYFKNDRNKPDTLEKLKNKKGLIEKLCKEQGKIIEEFMGCTPDPEVHDIDYLNASFVEFAGEIIDKIIENIEEAKT